MTLRFYLLRHAKAEPHSLNKDDKERSLSPSGVRQAEALGAWLAGVGNAAGAGAHVPFEVVYCSAATRTRETWDALEHGFQAQHSGSALIQGKVEYVDALYHAPAEKMLNLLQQTPADVSRVLLIGHNPGVSDLAGRLAAEGDAEAQHDVTLSYPTCGLSIFEFSAATWQEAGAHNCRITAFETFE